MLFLVSPCQCGCVAVCLCVFKCCVFNCLRATRCLLGSGIARNALGAGSGHVALLVLACEWKAIACLLIKVRFTFHLVLKTLLMQRLETHIDTCWHVTAYILTNFGASNGNLPSARFDIPGA